MDTLVDTLTERMIEWILFRLMTGIPSVHNILAVNGNQIKTITALMEVNISIRRILAK